MLLALNYWLFFVPPSLYPQRANQAQCNFWKAYMFSLNESSWFFFCQTYITVWSTLSFFGPLFGFALRHSAVPLFLVQRLVPPNGHRCLNFNFAEGGRKKRKKERDLLTSELRRRAASISVNWQGGKKEIGDNSYMLHCWRELPAPAAEHTGLTFEDAHYTTLHSFPLSES